MPEQSTSPNTVTELAGATVYDAAGARVGTIAEIVYDRRSRPEWLGVATDAGVRVLVPTAGMRALADGVAVPYERTMLVAGPDVGRAELAEGHLYAHFGLPPDGTATPEA